MTSLAAQAARIRDLLQDQALADDTIVQAHKESLQRLAQGGAFPQLQWINAVANQGLYVLRSAVVQVSHVLYNEQVLRYATEQSLDRRVHGWEGLQNSEPRYWLLDNQNPTTLRIVPAPTRTGSLVPVIPSPLFQDMRDNLVVFLTEDVAEEVDDIGDDPIPTLLDWDDVLVWETARMLAERETEGQNLPVAQTCKELVTLWHALSAAGK